MERTFTVSNLTSEIKALLEEGFSQVRLEGEISNFRPASSGHWYFTLKDADAVISAVMFRNRLSLVDFTPEDGLQVLVSGSVSVYEKRGSYQIICESMEQAGQGKLLLLLEERKRRLAAEGLFDVDKKVPLPPFPARVAVVTSPTGAALRDILTVLARRAAGLDLVILPAPVQGAGAAEKLAQQVATADRLKLGDVIIVARGGGSLEDLLPFSEEVLVRAIAACETPVISAVGHEIDVSLSDLAADLRAATPSAAAELVAQSRQELLRGVMNAGHSIAHGLLSRLNAARAVLRPYGPEQWERTFTSYLQPLLQRTDDAKEDLLEGMSRMVQNLRRRLESQTLSLDSISPFEVLKRGYAIVRKTEGGRVVSSASGVSESEDIEIQWHDGRRGASVRKRSENGNFEESKK